MENDSIVCHAYYKTMCFFVGVSVIQCMTDSPREFHVRDFEQVFGETGDCNISSAKDRTLNRSSFPRQARIPLLLWILYSIPVTDSTVS